MRNGANGAHRGPPPHKGRDGENLARLAMIIVFSRASRSPPYAMCQSQRPSEKEEEEASGANVASAETLLPDGYVPYASH